MDIREALASAERALVVTLRRATTDELHRPTPCAEWDVRALITHTLGTAELFASVIDNGPPPADGAMTGTGHLLDGGVLDACGRVLGRSGAAWASVEDMDAVLNTPLGAMPAGRLAAIATFSAVVHGWDLAAALDAPRDIEPALLSIGVPVAGTLAPQLRPAGAFADPRTVLPGPSGTYSTEAFIASLGRDPDWTAASSRP